MKNYLFTGLSLFLFLTRLQAQDRDDLFYKNGVVVSARIEASSIGLDVLKKGGNAIDAAIAVQFALAVVYPDAGNIGGGGFMVYRTAKGETAALDFREKAPAGVTRNMYLDAAGNAIEDKSLYGSLSAGVPGTVDGMVKAYDKYGKRSWKRLVQPAINLAINGFTISETQARELNENKNGFLKYNSFGNSFIRKAIWKKGDLLKQPELDATLIQIRDNGRAGFYKGKVAANLIREMNRGKGIITEKDLDAYSSTWRTPVIGYYKGYKIISMPPPSSGGIALIQLLQSISPYPLKKWGFNSDSTVRLIVEAERRVYADRSKYLGDPDFFSVPQEQLLNPSYQLKRMSTLDWQHATLSKDINPGNLASTEKEETTHYSIVDKQGNSVSVTTTLNGSYGSLVVVKGDGFLLNNEMDDFSVKPGSPNAYGLIGGEANSIAPGKRMLSSMTPTIIEKDSKLYMVVGTPGGATIITSVFQAIINVIDFNMTMQDAVAARRFHSQWLPDVIYSEDGAFSSELQQKLTEKGYNLAPRGLMGEVNAILSTPQGYQAGTDHRSDDATAGW